jgi:hypothetical protein
VCRCCDMSVASLVRSAVSGVSQTAAPGSTSPLWADANEEDIQDICFETGELQLQEEIHFENIAQIDAESDVEEAVAQVVVSDRASKPTRANLSASKSEKSPALVGERKVDDKAAWFSIGSEKHMSGSCKPCAFFHLAEGCENGTQCEFCHRCPPREKQRRKRLRRRLLREHGLQEQNRERRAFGHSRQNSTASTGTASTWDTGSTVDSADFVASIGVASRQSSGSLEGCGSANPPLVPLGFVQAMVPVYGMHQSRGWQPGDTAHVDPAQGVGNPQAVGLGYEYLPSLHGAQIQQAHVEVVGSEAACAPPYAHAVAMESMGECEPVLAAALPQHHVNEMYGCYNSYQAPIMVPMTYHMQMPTAVRANPRLVQQQPSFCATPIQSPPLASLPTSVWRAPVCHVRNGSLQ